MFYTIIYKYTDTYYLDSVNDAVELKTRWIPCRKGEEVLCINQSLKSWRLKDTTKVVSSNGRPMLSLDGVNIIRSTNKKPKEKYVLYDTLRVVKIMRHREERIIYNIGSKFSHTGHVRPHGICQIYIWIPKM